MQLSMANAAANDKWFRNPAVSRIIAETMDEMGLKTPPTRVDIADIRRKYHSARNEGNKVTTVVKPGIAADWDFGPNADRWRACA